MLLLASASFSIIKYRNYSNRIKLRKRNATIYQINEIKFEKCLVNSICNVFCVFCDIFDIPRTYVFSKPRFIKR